MSAVKSLKAVDFQVGSPQRNASLCAEQAVPQWHVQKKHRKQCSTRNCRWPDAAHTFQFQRVCACSTLII
jgi:hypothetical protein